MQLLQTKGTAIMEIPLQVATLFKQEAIIFSLANSFSTCIWMPSLPALFQYGSQFFKVHFSQSHVDWFN